MRYYVSIACAAVIVAGCFSSARASAFASPAPQCASSEEREALNFRAMQSELMVAALSCNKRDAYNKFVSMHQQHMPALGDRLRGYFQRVSASDPKDSLNSFVTDLANRSSKVSLSMNRQIYCNNANTVFTVLLNGANPYNMSRHFSKLHDVGSCR